MDPLAGFNNPLFGVIKTQDTIAKITKLVYVYKADTLSLVGVFSTPYRCFHSEGSEGSEG